MMCRFIIFYALALFCSKCDGHYDRSCRVSPRDQYVEAGSEAEITCRSACVPGKVFWTLNSRLVNESLSHQINSTHSVLLLPHPLLQDLLDSKAVVQCLSEDNHQVLGGTIIRVYTKPHNLACVLHSNGEVKEGLPDFFTCSWEHHSNSPLKVTYSLMCDCCTNGQREICKSDTTNCHISALNTAISFVQQNTIYVRARTEAWETNSSNYSFNASQIFKIPPRQVNVTAFRDHILVTWNRLPNMGVSGRCQIKYEYTKDEEIVKEVLNKTLAPGENGNLTIDHVESCLDYHVSARCALDQAPWSYWSPERTIRTKLKKNNVILDVWWKVLQLNGQRKVHVKWKGIPVNCPGTLTYSISHSPYDQLPSRANDTRALCGNTSCDIILNREVHRMKLTIFYNGDFLAEDSFQLPAAVEDESDRLFHVENIDTKHELNGLLVRWTTPFQPVSGYVIDWAHDSGDFDWERTEKTSILLKGLADKKPYNITVTPLFGQKTGQSTQISGVCSSFANPGNVNIDNLEADDRSAYVSWSIKPQENCSDAVLNYTVVYGTAHEPHFNVTISNSKQEVYLRGLKPGTHYSVRVKATARTGTSESSEGQFKTKGFDQQLIPIIVLTGSLLIIFCFGLCCIIQKLDKRPVPNPALSSLALWPKTTHRKTEFSFELFSTPSKCLCDRVYTEEMYQTSKFTNSKTQVTNERQNRRPPSQDFDRQFLFARSSLLCGSRASPLKSESSQFNPYRSQNAEESPVPGTSKQNKGFPLRSLERRPSYVSLDLSDS